MASNLVPKLDERRYFWAIVTLQALLASFLVFGFFGGLISTSFRGRSYAHPLPPWPGFEVNELRVGGSPRRRRLGFPIVHGARFHVFIQTPLHEPMPSHVQPFSSVRETSSMSSLPSPSPSHDVPLALQSHLRHLMAVLGRCVFV